MLAVILIMLGFLIGLLTSAGIFIYAVYSEFKKYNDLQNEKEVKKYERKDTINGNSWTP